MCLGFTFVDFLCYSLWSCTVPKDGGKIALIGKVDHFSDCKGHDDLSKLTLEFLFIYIIFSQNLNII